MNGQLLESLAVMTAEEQAILEDRQLDKSIYTDHRGFTIESKKMLEKGRLIALRPHTRFVDFPRHSHNYIEMMYTCKGSIAHTIDGRHSVLLRRGELLLLSCAATHEIKMADKEDIAVNFMILPQFFDTACEMMDQDNILSRFLSDNLRGKQGEINYLHFKVAEALPVQNLVENLILSITDPFPNRRSINQITMGLLFLQLLNYTEKIQFHQEPDYANSIIIGVMREIEENYRTATLTTLARDFGQSVSQLSKLIKQRTGCTFQEVLQSKRFAKAAELLENTTMTVNEISNYVGYANTSYFHRRFQALYGTSPAQYRRL